MEFLNKMINFVMSSCKRTSRRINYIANLAVTEPTCGSDPLGITAKFTMIIILMFSSIFIENALIKLLSILCLVFVVCIILKEPDYEQE